MRPITALCNAITEDVMSAFPDLGDQVTEMRSPSRYAARLLIDNVARKCKDEIDEVKCNQVAAETFLRVNGEARLYKGPRVEDRFDAELYKAFKHQVGLFFDRLVWGNSWTEIWLRGDLGNGASTGATGTDYYSKLFSSELTTTDTLLYDLYKRSTYHDPRWHVAEEARSNHFGACKSVSESRLSYVRKNDRTSRTTETQPTLNMFFQRGLSSVLEQGLREQFHIDLAYQPDVNRDLARLGSVDGSLSTLDLSSASDCISLTLFKDVVPRTYWDYFLKTRCARMKVPKTGNVPEQVVEMNMLSGMGNGYTFSFQTVLFSCMVKAAFVFSKDKQCTDVFCVRGKKVRANANWGVFGDDIIVPCGDMTVYVCRLLRMCGFTLNSAKSFYEGPFRESCGGDYLRGVNVRPVFVKSLKSRESRYVAINRLVEWSAEHGIKLVRAVRLLLEMTPRPFYVPPTAGLDSGVRVDLLTKMRADGLSSFPHRAKLRLVRNLALDVFVDRIECGEGGKPRRYIASGVLLAVLRGDIRSQVVPLPKQGPIDEGKRRLALDKPAKLAQRPKDVEQLSYRTVEACTPNWCVSPDRSPSWARLWGSALRHLI